MPIIRHRTLTGDLAPGQLVGAAEWDDEHVIDAILFSDLSGTPTTLAGYGITDGVTAAGVAAGFQPLSAVLTATTAAFTADQASKLSAIGAGATANASDADLRDRATHTGTQTASTISDFDAAADARVTAGIAGKQDVSAKGQAGGYASLDGAGKVPATQLPSYVDDVIEGATLGAFPATGEAGKIYVALDTGKTWRWSGSAYAEISASPGSTDAVTEGAANLYFTEGRVRSASLTGYADAASRLALAAGDSVLVAFGKVGKWLADLAPVAFTGAWADLTGKPTTLAGAGITDAASSTDLATGLSGKAGLTVIETRGRSAARSLGLGVA